MRKDKNISEYTCDHCDKEEAVDQGARPHGWLVVSIDGGEDKDFCTINCMEAHVRKNYTVNSHPEEAPRYEQGFPGVMGGLD